MKAYTDLEQSKTLAEFLPNESADCYWDYDEMQKFHRISWFEDGYNKESQLMFNENNLCAWSLAALLNFLPNTLYWFDNAWHCEYVDEDGVGILGTNADNALDACYEMIIKLYE